MNAALACTRLRRLCRRRPGACRRRPVGLGTGLAQALPRPRAGRRAPGRHRAGGGGGARLCGARRERGAAGRQHRPGRRRRARCQRHAGAAEPDALEPRARASTRANLTLTVEAGCVLQAVQQAAADAGLLFPLSLAAEGSCTIGGNLATNAGGTQVLRFGNARELCLGLEVVTADGRGLGRPVGPAQGQHRLRPARPVHRQRRHAGHHHRGHAEAQPAARGRGHRAGRVPARWSNAWRCSAWRRPRLGAGLTGFEVMNRFSLDLVARHFPPCPSRCRKPPGRCCWSSRTTRAKPRHAHASNRCSKPRWKPACIDDAVVAESLTQSQALWHLRESIPLAQSQEGPNIKHDISLPVSAHPRLRARAPMPRWRRPSPACGWSTSATWATATCTTTCRRPRACRRQQFMDRHEHAVNTLVYDAVLRRGWLDLRRARRRRAEARRTGTAQVAGGAADDAGHQARARPARPAQSWAGAVAAEAVAALPRKASQRMFVDGVRRTAAIPVSPLFLACSAHRASRYPPARSCVRRSPLRADCRAAAQTSASVRRRGLPGPGFATLNATRTADFGVRQSAAIDLSSEPKAPNPCPGQVSRRHWPRRPASSGTRAPRASCATRRTGTGSSCAARPRSS